MLRLTKGKLIHVLLAIFLLSETAVQAISPVYQAAQLTPPSLEERSASLTPTILPNEAGTVSITDAGFLPQTITVTVGSEVTWINDGGKAHGVTLLAQESSFAVYLPVLLKQSSGPSPDTGLVSRVYDPGLVEGLSEQPAQWSSGLLNPGDSFSRPFNEIGSFSYFDSEQPDKTGVVVVEPANEAPAISITSPAAGATAGVGNLLVSGTWADDGAVVDVAVNGVVAGISGNNFQATIPMESGNQTIIAEVKDDQEATAIDSVVVLVDGEGPIIDVLAPRNRQSVYTLQPFLDISFSDFGDSIDTNSLLVSLTKQGDQPTDVSADLTVSAGGASGAVTNPLTEDSSYILSATIDDTLGNSSVVTTTFFVPIDPASIVPPQQGDQPGWVSGMVYDSSSCDPELTECTGLAGARVTVEEVQVPALAQLRDQRQRQTMARVAGNEPFVALDPSSTTVTKAITGTAITGPDGFFAFPLNQTSIYWLRVEKDGFTYGQRELEVVRDRSSTTNDIYLTPIDPAVTDCDASGCSHSNSDDSIRLDIPAGAIGSGQAVSVTATLFDNVEFLPSGELPAGTWETYALNLGGASEITFTVPVTLQLANELGFTAGITIPLGYWNQITQQWEHAGIGTVDPTEQWVETTISHFSNYDLNFPIFLSDVGIDIGGDEFDRDDERNEPGDEKDEPCGAGSSGCFINFKSGTVHEWVDTPPVQILGDPVNQQLRYSTARANPSEVIDLRVSLNTVGSVQSFGYMGYELYLQGKKTATHYVPVNLNATGELGRFRYYWDGLNAQGDRLPPGAYSYQVKFTFPYLAEYCRPLGGIFGNEPNCTTGGTGRFVRGEKVLWQDGTVTLHGDNESPYGVGWVVAGQQQLFENEAGDILIADGGRHDEFYFPQKDQLRDRAAALDALPLEPYPAATENDMDREEAEKPEFWREPAERAPREAPPDPAPLPTMPDLPVYQEQVLAAADGQSPSLNVCGEININTTWTLANSPYVVTCAVSVASNVTLTIEPGVAVRFQSGTSLMVAGELVANGLEASQIKFESDGAQIPASWDQIAFLAGSSGSLDWITVSHGGYDTNAYPQFGAVTIASNDVSLTSVSLIENGVALFVTGGAAPSISSSIFISNSAWYGGGIFSDDGSAPLIEGNQFIGNIARGGGAIYALENNPTIRENQFYNNGGNSVGGAIYVDWMSSASIVGNHFEGNNGSTGGAIYIYNEIAKSSVISNTFIANSATAGGGAISDESHQGVIRANTFISNSARNGAGLEHWDYFDSPYSTIIEDNSFIGGTARDGGGVDIRSGDPLVRNNIFANNVAEYGGAMRIWGAPRLFHNIMWNNVADLGGAIANFESDSLPQIHNNIIISNTATFTNVNGYLGGGGIYNGTGRNYVSFGDHNIVWGNAGLDYQEVPPGPNDVPADPLFVDPANLDFHLQPGSPAIDAADPAYDFGDDFEGAQRPMGLAPDIGIYEYPAFGVDNQSASESVGPGETFTYVLQLVNPDNQLITAAVSDSLPQELSFDSYFSPAFTCLHDGSASGGLLNCTGDISAGGQERITITVTAGDSIIAPVQMSDIVEATAGPAEATDQSDMWLSWCKVQVNDGPIGDDLRAAIKASKVDDLIKVSGRCVTPEGPEVKSRTLQGGWNRTFDLRLPSVYTTTLDADYQGVVIEATGTATIEGFVITHGGDSGLWASNEAIIQNNIVEHNIQGGIFVEDSAIIRNNIVRYNQNGYGGGIHVRSEDINLLVDSNLIMHNHSVEDGGGIAVNWSGTVRNNIIVGNVADDDGGGLYFSEKDRAPIIEHNTIWGNSAGVSGGGLGLTSIGWHISDIIRNNAIISNTAPTGGGIFISSPMVGLDYNNVWGNSPDEYNVGATFPANDISADPRFVDAAGGDFHIMADSPMIDAADPLTDYYPDFDGDPRPMGDGGSDIGADEFPANTAFSRTASDYSRLEYEQVNETYTRYYLDGTEVHFNVDNKHDFTLEPDGMRTAYSYNPDGSVETVAITPPSEGSPRWTWSFAYSNGRLTSITDPVGRITDISIDDNNHLTGVTLADGASRVFVYDGQGLMTQQVDQNGAVSDYQYDDLGRLNQMTAPAREIYDPQSGTVSIEREVRSLITSDTGYQLLNFSAGGSPAVPGAAVPLSWMLIEKMTFGRGSVNGTTDRWGFWADEKDGLGRLTRTFRNLDGTADRLFTPDKDCIDYTYDDRGNVLSEARMGFDQCIIAPWNRDPNQVQTWRWTYEERFNQVKSQTDPNGHTTDYLYDYEVGAGEAGRLVQHTYPEVDNGQGLLARPTELFTYNAWGLPNTQVDRRGVVTKYIYAQGTAAEASNGGTPLFAAGVTPVPGHLTQVIIDYGGENLTYTYKEFDGAGNPGLSLAPDNHEATTFTYDAMNRVVREVDALGMVSQSTYDGRGNVLQKVVDYTANGVAGRNITSDMVYDAEDRLLLEVTQADDLLIQMEYAYDINGKLALERDARGAETRYQYDLADQLTNIIDPEGYVITQTFALDGQLIEIIDEDGYVTRYEYDEFDRRIKEIQDFEGLKLTSHYAYDLKGNMTSFTDPNGDVTCYGYDSLHRQISKTQDCGDLNLVSHYHYDLNDNLVRQTDYRATDTVAQYDNLNRLVLERMDDGGLNLETSYSYDPAGNLFETVDEQGVVNRLTYSELNLVVSDCDDANGLDLCTTYGYDRLHNVDSVTDPNGTVTQMVVNAFGKEEQQIQDAGGLAATTTTFYDNALNVHSLIDPNGNQTLFTHNLRGDRIRTDYADDTAVDEEYDGRRNLSSQYLQDGNNIDYAYDGAGRLITRTYGIEDHQYFEYDALGRLARAEQTNGSDDNSVSFFYNAIGDLITTTQSYSAASWNVVYSHDYPAGELRITYPSGTERLYEYDPLKRLSRVEGDGNALIADYAFFDAAGYQTLTYGNGLVNRLDYDAIGRTTRISSAVADYRYGYDPAGNRLYMQRAHEPNQPADVYDRDGLYQLTQVWYGADSTDKDSITSQDVQESFALDGAGNRLERQLGGASQSYLPNDGSQLSNAMNRYESVDGVALAYDARGNTLDDGTHTYTYDRLNRLASVSGPGGEATYTYDALGRRLASTVDGNKTIFIYDYQGQVLEERSAVNQLLAAYTYGAALDEPLSFERQGTTYMYHRDALGSVTEVSNAAGALVERYTYEVYGAVSIFAANGSALVESAVGNPYLFNSRRFDPESGNYYYRARHYSPSLGRFLQMDPAGLSDGTNLYRYVKNQPELLNDPSGMFAVKAGMSVKVVLAAGPLPWPGTWWQLRLFTEAKFFKCCNQQTKRTEVWADTKIGLSLEIVFGKTIGKKLAKIPPDNDKFKRGRGSSSSGASMFDQVKPCPPSSCSGFAEGFIEGKGGVGVGIKISLKFPVYPELIAPSMPEVSAVSGVMGLEISAGIRGGGKCVGKVGNIFDLF